jgi:glyoxylase-like metal-dependent hydrolase (beta-lactamase superfamily II)
MESIVVGVWSIHLGDTGPAGAKLPMHAYVVMNDARTRALYIDAAFAPAVAVMRALAAEGVEPVGMLLTHRHFVGLADAWSGAMEMLRGAPFLLHPDDAAHEQARRWGRDTSYEDPVGHSILREFGVACWHFPGHTAGHVVAHHTPTGVLFVGDNAMTHAAGSPPIATRPPAAFSTDDVRLQASWAAFDGKPRVLAPFHGLPLVDPGDEIFAALRSHRQTAADALVAFQKAADQQDGKTYIKA